MESKTHPELPFGPDGYEAMVPVIAQPHAYLLRKLEEYMGQATAIEAVGMLIDGASPAEALNLVLTAGDDLLYDLLTTIIPDLETRMSKHQFAGYRTAADYEAGSYSRADDRSPTIPQIKEAFKVASRVSGLDVLKTLYDAVKGWVSPKDKDDLKDWIKRQFRGSAPSLPSSPGMNGGSNQNGSRGTPQTAAAGVETPSTEMADGATAPGSGTPQPT